MECKQFKENLYRFMDDELDNDQLKTEIQEHLHSCPICSLEYEKELKMDKFIKGHLIQEKAPFELREAVVAKIEKANSWQKYFDVSRLKLIPSLGAVFSVILIIAFIFATTLTQPFPVFAESVNRHVDFLKGGYPLEIKSDNIDEVLAWFKGKLDFAVTRPHLDHRKVKLLGARICHLKGQKVAYLIYEKDGKSISAFVIDYESLRLPNSRETLIADHGSSRVYAKGEKGYESVFCFHKKVNTGCVIVSDMPGSELMKLMG